MDGAGRSETLAFRVAGDGARAVVCVHGMAQSGAFWEPTLRSLPPGYRGYAVDLPGFGESAHIPGPYTIQTHAAALDGFMRRLELHDVVLAGNSMGGVVCQQYAISYPGRLAGLILVSTGPYVMSQGGPAVAPEVPLDREAARDLVAHFFVRPPAGVEPFVQAAMQASPQARLETRLSSAAIDLRPALARIAVPTMIVQGARDDRRPPALGAEMAALIPGSELHVIAGTGHTPMLEDPATWQTLLHRFLSRLPAPSA